MPVVFSSCYDNDTDKYRGLLDDTHCCVRQ